MSESLLLHGWNESVGIGTVQAKQVLLTVTVALTAAWSSEGLE